MKDDCGRCFGAFVKMAAQFVISWQQKSSIDDEGDPQKRRSGALTAAFCASRLLPLRNSPAEEVTLKNAVGRGV